MKSNNSTKDELSSEAMLRKYLDRIGIEKETASAMIGENIARKKPNESDLGLLLRAHLTSIPFENLSQHVHPSAVVTVDGENKNGTDETVSVQEIPVTKLPSLDVQETLQKLVLEGRGGFCWEINTAFAWLLRQLGYQVRFGNSNVLTPGGPVPGHLCLYVDGLREDGVALHVDPGFGDAPRTPMPAMVGNTIADPMIGDEYQFLPNDDATKFLQSSHHVERFDAVLFRSRHKGGIGGSPMVDMLGMEAPPPAPPEPMAEPVYLLNFDDDLQVDCEEFQQGLSVVLSDDEANLFASKRMCVILRENGFDYVGPNYWKQVRNGSEVHREALSDELAYRETLEKVAGIRLTS